jgi:hypothetical protein
MNAEYLRGFGTTLVVVVLLVILVGILYFLWGKLKDSDFSFKKSKTIEMPKTKVDGDNIKIRFVVEDTVTVFNYDTKDKKITVKGKEREYAGGVLAIKAADGTVYFCVEDTGMLYQLKGKNIVDAFATDEFDDEDEWDD